MENKTSLKQLPSNDSPFLIRLELLKLAAHMQVDGGREPTADSVIAEAEKLNQFVSGGRARK
jgi:hypothetical protein